MKIPKKNISFGSVMIKIAASLFCLVLISTSLMSGLYARYTTNSHGGDSAKVIKFGNITLTETGSFTEDKKLVVTPGVDLTKKVMVSFDGSESATYLFIKIIPSSHWISTDNRTFKASINGKNIMDFSISTYWEFLDVDDGSYIYYTVLIPNTTVENVDIIANNGKINVENNISQKDIPSMKDMSLNIQATVVQIGGFKDAKAAWASVSSND